MIYLAPIVLVVLIAYSIWFYAKYRSFTEQVPKGEL